MRLYLSPMKMKEGRQLRLYLSLMKMKEGRQLRLAIMRSATVRLKRK